MYFAKRKASLSAILLLLCACSVSEPYKLEYKDDPIPYESNINSCNLILSVNGESLPTTNNNYIVYKDVSRTCPSLNTNELGTKELVFVLNGEKYTHTFNVVDVVSPIIKGETDIEITKGADFDLTNHYTVYDNADPDPKVSIIGEININEAGSYKIKIKAIDASKNESYFDMVIHVKDKDEQLSSPNEEKETVIQNNASPPYKKPAIDKQESMPQLEKPIEKSFLFSAGFTYESAYTACNQYGTSLINDNKTNGYTCTPIKSDDEYLGYRITFP